MSWRKYLAVMILPLALPVQHAFAQEKTELSIKGEHQLSLGLGHTYLTAKMDDGTHWLGVVSWSADYTYWLTNHWGLGLQTEFLNERFKVETDKGEVLEREYPVILLPAANFKASEHIHLVAGAGTEISKGEHLFITRLGAEYIYPLPKKWEIGAALVWDEKWTYYHAFGISLFLSHGWGK